jgi:hypothetical protein
MAEQKFDIDEPSCCGLNVHETFGCARHALRVEEQA